MRLATDHSIETGLEGKQRCPLWKDVRQAVGYCLTENLDHARKLFGSFVPCWDAQADHAAAEAFVEAKAASVRQRERRAVKHGCCGAGGRVRYVVQLHSCGGSLPPT